MMRLFQSFLLPLLVIATLDVMSFVSGADIIVSVFSLLFSSHVKGMSSIAGALTRRGHNVTLLTSSCAGTKGFRRDSYTKSVQYKCIEFEGEHVVVEDVFASGAIQNLLASVDQLMQMKDACVNFFDDAATVGLLNESHFDLLIGDVFEGCDAMLASYLGIPFIAVTTTVRYPFVYDSMYGIPFPSSYVPFAIFALTDRMSFFERIASFIEHNVAIPLIERRYFPALEETKVKHGIAPGQSIPELLSGAELWLCMTNFALDYPHPTAPNWVAIANIGDRPAKPLQKDYKSFVEGSGEHGFIVFSLGTHVPELPNIEMAEAFAAVFSELPQRVLWRYTGTRPRNLGNNTMMVDWLPQNDLIGHPKARLLIYHAGFTGILEAVYHAVPMVVMPIFAEQESNALRVVTKGMGRRLEKDSISYETVKAAVTEVLDNSSYRENVRRISKIYRDAPSKPDETVVFWVEHILKFGGSHLRSRALELGFVQLHSIDVIAFIVGIVLVIGFLLYSCCRRCLSCCLSSKKTKVE